MVVISLIGEVRDFKVIFILKNIFIASLIIGMPQLPQLFPMIPSGFFGQPNGPQQQQPVNPNSTGEQSGQPSSTFSH